MERGFSEVKRALPSFPARRGAAAAVNAGIRDTRHALICQVDQDVVVQPGWLAPLLEALRAPDVAAAQGRYVAGPSAGVWARAG